MNESDASIRKCNFVAEQDITVQDTPRGPRITCPVVKGLLCDHPRNAGAKCGEMEADQKTIVLLSPLHVANS